MRHVGRARRWGNPPGRVRRARRGSSRLPPPRTNASPRISRLGRGNLWCCFLRGSPPAGLSNLRRRRLRRRPRSRGRFRWYHRRREGRTRRSDVRVDDTTREEAPLRRRGETSLTRRVDRRPRRSRSNHTEASPPPLRDAARRAPPPPRVWTRPRRRRARRRRRREGSESSESGSRRRPYPRATGGKTRDRWTRRPPRDRSPLFLSPPSPPRSARIARLRSNPSDQSTSPFPPSRSRARFPRRSLDAARRPPDCAQSNLSRNAAASCRNRVAPAKVSSSHALRSVRALTTRDAKESRFSVSVSPKSVGAGASALEGVTTRARVREHAPTARKPQ